MIKPGDISDELIEKAEAECKYNTGEWDCADGKEVAAAILNAAIKTGVVSPPVRILRSRFGVLDRTYLFIDDNKAQSHASPGDSSEHWKGQTE